MTDGISTGESYLRMHVRPWMRHRARLCSGPLSTQTSSIVLIVTGLSERGEKFKAVRARPQRISTQLSLSRVPRKGLLFSFEIPEEYTAASLDGCVGLISPGGVTRTVCLLHLSSCKYELLFFYRRKREKEAVSTSRTIRGNWFLGSIICLPDCWDFYEK